MRTSRTRAVREHPDSFDAEVRYLAVEDVLTSYAEVFSCTLRQAEDQLRSRDALEGALARPQWYAHYGSADLAYRAAVLAHGIAETQPFVEGNKRTALAAQLVFLDINGYQVSATQSERMAWMIGLSEGMTVDELADRIRDRLMPA